MLPEAPGGAETAAAGGAVERFVSAVNQLVRLQVVPLTEAPPTDAAQERLLAAVDAFMSDQVLGHAEALPADLAHEGLLAAVRALVQVSAGLRGEGFVALCAAERRRL